MQNHIDENKIIRLINAINRYMHRFRFKILEIVKFPATRQRKRDANRFQAPNIKSSLDFE